VTVSGSGVYRGTNELFFQAAIPIPDDDIPSQRSPTQVVISALGMVI